MIHLGEETAQAIGDRNPIRVLSRNRDDVLVHDNQHFPTRGRPSPDRTRSARPSSTSDALPVPRNNPKRRETLRTPGHRRAQPVCGGRDGGGTIDGAKKPRQRKPNSAACRGFRDNAAGGTGAFSASKPYRPAEACRGSLPMCASHGGDGDTLHWPSSFSWGSTVLNEMRAPLYQPDSITCSA